MSKYVYRCPICKKNVGQPIQPTVAPWCAGPENTHWKEMAFVPEASTDTPAYLAKKA